MGGRAERNRRNWGRPRVVVARSRPPLLLDVRPRFPRRKPSPMGGDGGPRVHQRAKVTDTKRLRSGTYRLIREPYLVERSSRSSAGHGSCSLSLLSGLSALAPVPADSDPLLSPACEKEKKNAPCRNRVFAENPEARNSENREKLWKNIPFVTWRTRMIFGWVDDEMGGIVTVQKDD